MQSTQTRQDYSEKKIKRYREQDADKVRAYLEKIVSIPKSKLVYVDETGIDSYLCREHCYCLRGQKVIGCISGKRYRRVGIVAAKMQTDILAPLQYDGTMDSLLFETWFNQCLLPALPDQSVVIMDNAAFHRKTRLTLMAQNNGHSIIFLPPYSPQLNPIENFWAWLKGKIRSSVRDFNSIDDAISYCFQVV